MSSQFQHHIRLPFTSASPSLMSALRRRSPDAERQALYQFNASQPPERQIQFPNPDDDCTCYADGHLALLWRHVRNGEALSILARRNGARLRLPARPLKSSDEVTAFYRTVPRSLLQCLWKTVGDPNAFAELLCQGERTAISDLIAMHNAIPSCAEEIPTPARRSYAVYHPRLLALLWSIGGNEEARDALAARESVAPLPASIADWPAKFLERLWELARDGDALAELWRREEGLDVGAPLTSGTPSKVLAHRWCFRRDEEACLALLDRYRNLGVPSVQFNRDVFRDEHLGDRNVRALEQIKNWDLRAYDDLASWLVAVERNAHIDKVRAAKRGQLPAVGGKENHLPDAEDPACERLLHAVERQDELAERASWRQVAILKIKEGLRLTAHELELIALSNLLRRGVTEPTAAEVREAVSEVCRAVEARQAATKQAPMNTVLHGHKPVRHSQLKRITKLRVRHDLASEAIRGIATPATAADFRNILERFDVLFGRSKGEKWAEEQSPAEFVQELLEDIRGVLSRAAGDGADATALDRCRAALADYLRHFPLLLKAARVRELAVNLRKTLPALEVLQSEILAWLDGGRNWLSTLREKDATICAGFAEKLGCETFHPDPAMQAMWLRSVCTPGRPSVRLVHLDETYRTVRELGEACPPEARRLAEEMVRAALAGNAGRVASDAARMGAAVAELPGSWDVRRLRACLARLSSKLPRNAALLELCRKLAQRAEGELPAGLREWLDRDGCLGEKDGAAFEEGRLLRDKLRATLDPNAPRSDSVRKLLDLALAALLRTEMPSLTAESLCAAWELCHTDHRWNPEVPTRADDLVAAAWGAFEAWAACADWSAVSKAAARIRARLPHCNVTPRAVREELERVLSRLARGPRSRRRADLSAACPRPMAGEE
jgi:hypothetical protein